jgi:hypothetical protein
MKNFTLVMFLSAALSAQPADRACALEDYALSIGLQAYVYGYPLVLLAATERTSSAVRACRSITWRTSLIFARQPAKSFCPMSTHFTRMAGSIYPQVRSGSMSLKSKVAITLSS